MLRRARALLESLTGTAVLEDRRAHPRFDTNIRTMCRSVADNRSVPALIRNVSRTGINLLVDDPVREGTMLRIELPRTPDGPHTTVLACIMHAREEPDGWSLGGMFSLELSDEEMRLLGGKKQASGLNDQRAWVRYPARGWVQFRVLPGDEAAPEAAELVNLSPTGVGLVLDRELDAGSALSVTLKRVGGKPDRTLVVCVVYVTDRSDGKWAAGCQFLHELSDRDLNELAAH